MLNSLPSGSHSWVVFCSVNTWNCEWQWAVCNNSTWKCTEKVICSASLNILGLFLLNEHMHMWWKNVKMCVVHLVASKKLVLELIPLWGIHTICYCEVGKDIALSTGGACIQQQWSVFIACMKVCVALTPTLWAHLSHQHQQQMYSHIDTCRWALPVISANLAAVSTWEKKVYVMWFWWSDTKSIVVSLLIWWCKGYTI